MLAAVGVAGAAHAQTTTVRVEVSDSAHRPITGAELSIADARGHIVARGVTDTAGSARLRIRREGARYRAIARRLGYASAERAFPADRDSITLPLVMAELPNELSAVRVIAEEDLQRKYLFVDSTAITHSDRYVHDGMDVITKLRPDMAHGLGDCPGAQNLWINGHRVLETEMTIDTVAVLRAGYTSLKPHPYATGTANVPDYLISALAHIRPQDISEISARDCMDLTMGAYTESAIFIKLKPGIAWDPRIGSYSMAYRDRILGVFADDTGQPLDSAAVTDSASGALALTTTTGTISLGFLRDGRSTLRISKPGYEPTSYRVRLAPGDTTPITILLHPARKH